jgi:hypothetical protein
MQVRTAFRLLNDKRFEAKAKPSGFVMYPEVKSLVAKLSKEHGYSQSDIVQAAVLMFNDSSRSEELKLEKVVAPAALEVEFEDAYGDDYEPA